MLNSPFPIIELSICCGVRWERSSRIIFVDVVKDAVELIVIHIRAIKGDFIDIHGIGPIERLPGKLCEGRLHKRMPQRT